MTNRFWIPTLMAAALLLSACGDSEEAATSDREDDAAVTETTVQEDATALTNDEEDDALAEQPSPIEQEEVAGEEAEITAAEDVQADQETLAADPSEALEGEGGLPGEVTSAEVDDIIAETERRFEEAQQRLDEQFEEAQSEAEEVAPEGLEDLTNDVSADWETETDLPDSSLPASNQQEGELGRDDVQALIEETERRFEEAQQELDQQFQELEAQGAMEENGVNAIDESTEGASTSDVP